MQFNDFSSKLDSYREIKTIQSRSHLERPDNQPTSKVKKPLQKSSGAAFEKRLTQNKSMKAFQKSKCVFKIEKGPEKVLGRKNSIIRLQNGQGQLQNIVMTVQQYNTLKNKKQQGKIARPDRYLSTQCLKTGSKGKLERAGSRAPKDLSKERIQAALKITKAQKCLELEHMRPTNPHKIHREVIKYDQGQFVPTRVHTEEANQQPIVKYVSTPKQVVREIMIQNSHNQSMRTQLCDLRNRITKARCQLNSSNRVIEDLEHHIREGTKQPTLRNPTKGHHHREETQNPEQEQQPFHPHSIPESVWSSSQQFKTEQINSTESFIN